MEFILRNINHNNLLTGLLLVSILLLVIAKYFYFNQFSDFLNITQSNKYLTLYAKNGKKISVFNPLLYLFFVINCAIFIYLSIKNLQLDFAFFTIFIAVNLYILSFFLIKKICFEVVEINEVMTKILFQKITFNHYVGVLFFVFNLISLYVNPFPSVFYTYSSILFVGIFYLLFLLVIVFQNLRWLLANWFYFILYLCTFKISPLLIGGFLLSR